MYAEAATMPISVHDLCFHSTQSKHIFDKDITIEDKVQCVFCRSIWDHFVSKITFLIKKKGEPDCRLQK